VSLSRPGFPAVLYQGAAVALSLFLFRGRLGGAKARAMLPLVPVLAFVFVVNCFRGSGEVVARVGVFILVRQGVLRGTYYACVIALLFVMSRLLAKGFSQGELFGSLYTLSRAFGKPFGGGSREDGPPGETGFLVVLFCVLGMFQTAYSEMKVFFRKGERSLKRKFIAYVYAVWEKSHSEFDNRATEAWRTARPLPLDYAYCALQIAVLAAALVFPLPRGWPAFA
jgi:hypothetical protein